MPLHIDPDPEVGKSQLLRMIDVFLLGPGMIYVGITGKIPSWLRTVAVWGGIGTIAFNWANFKRLRESLRKPSQLPRGGS